MHITILGAGWLGRHLAELLLCQGASLTLTCIQPDSEYRLLRDFPSAKVVRTQDPADFLHAIQGVDAVIVCVAPSMQQGGEREQAYRNCYLKVAQSLEEACRQDPSVRTWVVISSTSVYGDQAGEVDESCAAPTSPTGQILLAMEQTMAKLPGRHVILRCGQLCGPARALRSFGGAPPGAADVPSNLTPLALIEEAVLLALEHPLNGIWNLVHPEHPLRSVLLKRAQQCMGTSVEPEPSQAVPSKGSKFVSGARWDQLRAVLELPSPPPLSHMSIWPPDGRPESDSCER